jgi:hypothetical protein
MNQKEIMRLLTKIHWKHQLQRDVAIRPIVSLNAWRNYCMESWIFRLFVKIGLRK